MGKLLSSGFRVQDWVQAWASGLRVLALDAGPRRQYHACKWEQDPWEELQIRYPL